MEPLSKVTIPTAVEGRTNMPTSGTHITTQDFMLLRPYGYHHPIPGASGRVTGQAKTNLMPIGQPIFGRARQNLRGFWVPYRLLCQDFDNFITDTPSYEATQTRLSNHAPFFYASTLHNLLWGLSVQVTDQQQISAGAYDYKYLGNYYSYSNGARYWLLIFKSLGYQHVIQDFAKVGDFKFNGFGILALAKVWLDWYANGQYLDSATVVNLEQLLKRCQSDYELTATDLSQICQACQVVGYDSKSYFISAWDSPVAPNLGNTHSNYVLPDITTPVTPSLNQGAVGQVSNSTAVLGRLQQGVYTSNAINTVSQYQLDSLKALTDFLKRNQLSGRAIDRYLARFGVQLKGESIKRSVYCGFKSIDINFGQVVQTADTNVGGQSNLGDKAGIGDSNDTYSFDYDTNGEYGIFIMLSSLLPDGDIVDGYDRHNRHLSRTDFYQPEFDQLGCMAIEKGEALVFTDDGKVNNTGAKYTDVFGFAPTYAEYKVGRSFFTGDISLPSIMNGGRAYSLYRFMDNVFGTLDLVQHGLTMTIGFDAAQYDRIFNSSNREFDHFICFYSFEFKDSSPAKSLFDTFEFKQNGKNVTLDSNGVKVN